MKIVISMNFAIKITKTNKFIKIKKGDVAKTGTTMRVRLDSFSHYFSWPVPGNRSRHAGLAHAGGRSGPVIHRRDGSPRFSAARRSLRRGILARYQMRPLL